MLHQGKERERRSVCLVFGEEVGVGAGVRVGVGVAEAVERLDAVAMGVRVGGVGAAVPLLDCERAALALGRVVGLAGAVPASVAEAAADTLPWLLGETEAVMGAVPLPHTPRDGEGVEDRAASWEGAPLAEAPRVPVA